MKLMLAGVFLGFLLAVSAGRELRQASVDVRASAGGTGPVVGTTFVSADISTPPSAESTEAAPTAPSEPPRLDVYCLVDLTESSTSFVAELASNAERIVDEIFGLTQRTRFGVGAYEDTADAPAFTNLLSITNAQDDVVSTLSGLTAIDANEAEESQFRALQTVATDDSIGFRQTSTKIVVWIGNAPAIDPLGDFTQQTVIDALQARGISVVAIDTGDLDATQQAMAIVEATSGILFTANSDGAFTSVDVATSSPGGSASGGASASGDIATVAVEVDGVAATGSTAVSLPDAIIQGVSELFQS